MNYLLEQYFKEMCKILGKYLKKANRTTFKIWGPERRDQDN